MQHLTGVHETAQVFYFYCCCGYCGPPRRSIELARADRDAHEQASSRDLRPSEPEDDDEGPEARLRADLDRVRRPGESDESAYLRVFSPLEDEKEAAV
jgi:hypothetical protein